MNFKTNELSSAIDILAKIAMPLSKSSLCDQQYCKIECKGNTANFSISNHDISITKKLSFTGKAINLYIDVIALRDVLKMFPKKCTTDITVKENIITISSNENKFTLQVPSEQIIDDLLLNNVNWNENKFEKLYQITADYIEFIKKDASVCVGKNDFRLAMTGVCLSNQAGKLEIASTDTYRLIRNITNIKLKENTPEIIISGTYLPMIEVADYQVNTAYATKENEKGEQVVIGNSRRICLQNIDTTIYFVPINDKFPPYQQVIPQHYDSKSLINVKMFSELVKKAATVDKITNGGQYSTCKLLIFKVLKTDKDKLKPNFDIYVANEDTIEHIYIGKLYCLHDMHENFGVSFNLLGELIKTMHCENIKMLMNGGGDKPIIFQYDSVTMLVMPRRLDGKYNY